MNKTGRKLSERNFHILKPAIIGALIASGFLVLGFAFLGDPKSLNFQRLIHPLLTVPLGGAIGGVFYSFINQLNFKNSQISILANFFSVLLYLFLLVTAFAWGTDVLE